MTGDDTVEKRRDIQQRFDEEKVRCAYIRYAWHGFNECLVTPRDSNQLYSTHTADQFFNTHTLAPKVTESRFLDAVPSFLLAIGILGTFFGLTIGLKGLDIGVDADVETLRHGIDSMIGSTAIAFVTSVWGVGLSVIVNFYNKSWESGIRRKLYTLQIQIDKLFPIVTAEGILNDMAGDSRESRYALKTLHEKIGEQLQEKLDTAGSRLQESLVRGVQDVMRESLEKLNTQASHQSTEALENLVHQFMDRMGETGAEQRRIIDEASGNMQNSVDNLGAQISSMVDRLSEQQQNLGAFQAQTEESLSRFAQQQTEHSKQIEQGTADLLKTLQSTSEALDRSSAQLNSGAGSLKEVSGSLQQASATLSGPVRDLHTRMASLAKEMEQIEKNLGQQIELLNKIQQNLHNASEGLSESADKANNGFKELEAHQKQFLEGLKQNLESTNKELRAQVEDLSREMEQWLQKYAEQVTQQTRDRMNEWNEQTRQFADNLHRSVNAISQLVDEIEGKMSRHGDN
jgi:predicted  nucleic acid-binding Zn-ribbon protein